MISNFALFSLNPILRILLPYLDRIIAAIDFVLEKEILARNTNTIAATCNNILTFQVEQTTILNLWINLCGITTIPFIDLQKPALYYLLWDYSDVDEIIKIDLCLGET